MKPSDWQPCLFLFDVLFWCGTELLKEMTSSPFLLLFNKPQLVCVVLKSWAHFTFRTSGVLAQRRAQKATLARRAGTIWPPLWQERREEDSRCSHLSGSSLALPSGTHPVNQTQSDDCGTCVLVLTDRNHNRTFSGSSCRSDIALHGMFLFVSFPYFSNQILNEYVYVFSDQITMN